MTSEGIPESGAHKEFEHNDPLELCGVVFPADRETSQNMARCFVEEFALLGFSRREVSRLFHTSFFAGTAALTREHGEAFIEGLLDEVFGEGDGSHA